VESCRLRCWISQPLDGSLVDSDAGAVQSPEIALKPLVRLSRKEATLADVNRQIFEAGII
jgi:hypothetical protein